MGYKCKKDFNPKKITGRPFIVDLFCKSETDSLIVEVRQYYVRLHDIIRLAYLRTFPGLSETKLYLAVPKTLEFSEEQLAAIIQNNISVIKVGAKDDVIFEKPHLFPEHLLPSKVLSLLQLSAFAIQRKIPPTFFDVLNLNNLSYGRELGEFLEEYGNIRNQDEEVEIILKYLEILWSGKYGKTQSVKAFTNFNDFEPMLKRI